MQADNFKKGCITNFPFYNYAIPSGLGGERHSRQANDLNN
jgi:hypothetical protein